MIEEVEKTDEEKEYKLSDFYNENKFAGRVGRIKFLLIPFVFFALIGFPISGIAGNYVTAISNFAGLAFFVFCGFFTLAPNKEERMDKLKRAVKRSWIFFLIMFISYLAINAAYLAYIGSFKSLFSAEYIRGRNFFNFFVLNYWSLPMGSSIWFIQSLAYSYLFFFLAEKLKLSKIYLPLLIILLVFTLLSGELAKLVGFPYFGYNYIPGGTLTKALPFMLIGMYLRKHIDKFGQLRRWIYAATFILGILCAVGEISLLRKLNLFIYTGNAIGYGIMAISVCCYAVTDPNIGNGFLGNHGGNYARRMYYLCQPIYLTVWVLCELLKPASLSVVSEFGSVICFAVCLIISYFIGLIKYSIATKNRYYLD